MERGEILQAPRLSRHVPPLLILLSWPLSPKTNLSHEKHCYATHRLSLAPLPKLPHRILTSCFFSQEPCPSDVGKVSGKTQANCPSHLQSKHSLSVIQRSGEFEGGGVEEKCVHPSSLALTRIEVLWATFEHVLAKEAGESVATSLHRFLSILTLPPSIHQEPKAILHLLGL